MLIEQGNHWRESSSTQRTFRARQATEANGQHNLANALSTTQASWGNTWARKTPLVTAAAAARMTVNSIDGVFSLCDRESPWSLLGSEGLGVARLLRVFRQGNGGREHCPLVEISWTPHMLKSSVEWIWFINYFSVSQKVLCILDTTTKKSPLRSLLPVGHSWPSRQPTQPVGLRQREMMALPLDTGETDTDARLFSYLCDLWATVLSLGVQTLFTHNTYTGFQFLLPVLVFLTYRFFDRSPEFWGQAVTHSPAELRVSRCSPWADSHQIPLRCELAMLG